MFKKWFGKQDDVELTEEEKAEKKALRNQKITNGLKTAGCFALGVLAAVGGLILMGAKANSEEVDETDETSEDTASDDSED